MNVKTYKIRFLDGRLQSIFDISFVLHRKRSSLFKSSQMFLHYPLASDHLFSLPGKLQYALTSKDDILDSIKKGDHHSNPPHC